MGDKSLGEGEGKWQICDGVLTWHRELAGV